MTTAETLGPTAAPRTGHRRRGLVYGAIGVAIFAGSLPATRAAVLGLDVFFVTACRAAIAGLLAGVLVLVTRQRLPNPREALALLIVAGGTVLGFPLLTALALKSVPAAHAIIFVGALPLATSGFALLQRGERPRAAFWPWAVGGSATVVLYALWHTRGGFATPDLLMLAAMLVCGLGYAEGSRIAKHIGSWQVICWALILSLPVSLPATLLLLPAAPGAVPPQSWIGLAYVTLFSMLIGFFFWYRGLAEGGVARVSQVQLFQPFLGFVFAALTLGEPISPDLPLVALIIVLCVAQARRHA
ncbi:MAG TPA: DMT family transporter [Dongiaceae bacterium]|nr:DMT family transporter [Dongiaceae bacterium]